MHLKCRHLRCYGNDKKDETYCSKFVLKCFDVCNVTACFNLVTISKHFSTYIIGCSSCVIS
jgi:hypothetical protein